MSEKEKKDTSYQVVYIWNIKNHIFSLCSHLESPLTDDLPLIQNERSKLVKTYKCRFVLKTNENGTYCSLKTEGPENEKMDLLLRKCVCHCTLQKTDATTLFSSSFDFGSDCLLFTREDMKFRREQFFSDDDLIIEFKIKRFFTEYDQLEMFKTIYSDYCDYFVQKFSISTEVLVQSHSLSFKVHRLMDEAAISCDVPNSMKCHVWMCTEFFLIVKISKIPYPYLRCNLYVCKSDGCKIFGRVAELFKSDGTPDELFLVLKFDIESVLKTDKNASMILKIQYGFDSIVFEQTGYEVKETTIQEKSEAKLNSVPVRGENGDCKFKGEELEFIRRFGHDMSLLHRSRKFSDISIISSDSVKFDVHRAILGVRSEAWAESFDTKVDAPTVIELNFDSQTVNAMLKYMYCVALPKTHNIDKMISLYQAGKEYKIVGLTEHCSSWLSTNLNVATICRILSLAESHKDENLKKTAMNFVMDHSVEVLKSKKWKLLMGTEPELVSTIFCYLNEKTMKRCKSEA